MLAGRTEQIEIATQKAVSPWPSGRRNLRFQFWPEDVQHFGESAIMHIPRGREVFFANTDKIVWHDASKSPLSR
jgi:hypothetical protein